MSGLLLNAFNRNAVAKIIQNMWNTLCGRGLLRPSYTKRDAKMLQKMYTRMLKNLFQPSQKILQNRSRPPKNLPKSRPSRLQNEGRSEHRKRLSWYYGIKGIWATQNCTLATPERLPRTYNFLFISDMHFHTILIKTLTLLFSEVTIFIKCCSFFVHKCYFFITFT